MPKTYCDRMQRYLSVIRVAYGYSSEMLAETLNMSRHSICRYENYTQQMPIYVFYALLYIFEHSMMHKAASPILHTFVYDELMTDEERNKLYSRLCDAKDSVSRKYGIVAQNKAIMEEWNEETKMGCLGELGA